MMVYSIVPQTFPALQSTNEACMAVSEEHEEINFLHRTPPFPPQKDPRLQEMAGRIKEAQGPQ